MKLAAAIICVVSSVAVAQPDKSVIRHHVRLHNPEMRACYEAALAKEPKLAGKVVATFVIGADGRVTASRAEGLPGVDACIAKVIATIRFPAPGKAPITINYPFLFTPGR